MELLAESEDTMKNSLSKALPKLLITNELKRNRVVSESISSDGGEFDGMQPLELDDIVSYENNKGRKRSARAKKSVSITNKQGKATIRINPNGERPIILNAANPWFLTIMELNKQMNLTCIQSEESSARARKHWKKALIGVSLKKDPWGALQWDDVPIENGIRHRYNPLTKSWSKERVLVKMEEEPFDKGAMRECFRMKKLSNFSGTSDWNRSSNNNVAKSYLEPVQRDTYFQDVKLQMDAKLWGEEYNRHNPPKKVDIFMMSVLEFPDRPDRPLFHVEHFISGNYVKYNSNSGFVEESLTRQTPHAFSHFTFERSGHELIVVDVQGVGDLYTDPQIHTSDGMGYGDGNLGTKGMALFFHSHTCNHICKSLGLTKFDLTSSEMNERVLSWLKNHENDNNNVESLKKKNSLEFATVIREEEVVQCQSPSEHSVHDFSNFFMEQQYRKRTRSFNQSVDINSARRAAKLRARKRTTSNYASMEEFGSSPPVISPPNSAPIPSSACDDYSDASSVSVYCGGGLSAYRRGRGMSEMSVDSGIVTSKEVLSFEELLLNKARPSNINKTQNEGLELDAEEEEHHVILGWIHLDLAKYHVIGRFCPADTDKSQFDREAAIFHLKCAADCGLVCALVTLAKLYYGMPRDILEDLELTNDELSESEKLQLGFTCFEKAAQRSDRFSMVFLARAFDTGLNLPNPEKMQSLKLALEWYEKVSDLDRDEGGDGDQWGMDDSPYVILARIAEIYSKGDEASGVERKPNLAGDLYNEAAESAMANMKGKLANKYYMLAEQTYEEEEETEE